jgi:hypothetical protein
MYIYGPAGSGKTYLIERLAHVRKGTVAVPYALTVGGAIIQMYDPSVHHAVASGPARARDEVDPRWVECARPAVLAGGELTLDMLELKYDAACGYYQAPPQLKANNGIFVVDDVGRQRCAPAELMNRWIVPMDRKVDVLTLHTGVKFQVPFDVQVIFSSNLTPRQIGDEAFLRRIGYKILVGPLGEADYRRVFASACAEFGVAFDEAAFDHLLAAHHHAQARPLMACYPRDLLSHIRDAAAFDGAVPVLEPESLARAWANNFNGHQEESLP